MAYGQFTLRHCLTLRGWMIAEDDGIPEDWVEIWEVETYQGSGFGKSSDNWQLERRNPNTSQVTLKDSRERFLRPEKSRQLSRESLAAIHRLSQRFNNRTDICSVRRSILSRLLSGLDVLD
jgi:hypothetical protein